MKVNYARTGLGAGSNRPQLCAAILATAVMLLGSFSADAAETLQETVIADKTLVVWVSPANLTQSGGTALTVNDTTIDRFDGIVFAELAPKVWMPGSNGLARTHKKQADWPKETVGPDEFVQMAIVYRGQQITMYRNGELYAMYAATDQPYSFGIRTAILFGPRHLARAITSARQRTTADRVTRTVASTPTGATT